MSEKKVHLPMPLRYGLEMRSRCNSASGSSARYDTILQEITCLHCLSMEYHRLDSDAAYAVRDAQAARALRDEVNARYAMLSPTKAPLA